MRYFFDQDQNSHWYLVNAAFRNEWNRWTDLLDDDEDGWDVPAFAQRIDSCLSMIDFERPRIGGTQIQENHRETQKTPD